jgi:hypothetical protein
MLKDQVLYGSSESHQRNFPNEMAMVHYKFELYYIIVSAFIN